MNEEIILEKFAKRFTQLIKNSSIEIPVLAQRLGIKSKSTIYRYMNAEMAPKIPTVKYASEIFNVNPLWLMGYDVPMERNFDKNIQITNKKTFNIPILGKIAAGQPIFVEEYLEGYLPVDPNIYGLSTADDLFYLRVSGQSMNKKIKNGDYALIKKQDCAEDGNIVVAIVNGDDEVTLKKYKKLNEQFVLLEPMSSDPTIEAITVDLKSTNFKIIGKAIGYFGKF